jgi:hypothetical protein
MKKRWQTTFSMECKRDTLHIVVDIENQFERIATLVWRDQIWQFLMSHIKLHKHSPLAMPCPISTRLGSFRLCAFEVIVTFVWLFAVTWKHLSMRSPLHSMTHEGSTCARGAGLPTGFHAWHGYREEPSEKFMINAAMNLKKNRRI